MRKITGITSKGINMSIKKMEKAGIILRKVTYAFVLTTLLSRLVISLDLFSIFVVIIDIKF